MGATNDEMSIRTSDVDEGCVCLRVSTPKNEYDITFLFYNFPYDRRSESTPESHMAARLMREYAKSRVEKKYPVPSPRR